MYIIPPQEAPQDTCVVVLCVLAGEVFGTKGIRWCVASMALVGGFWHIPELTTHDLYVHNRACEVHPAQLKAWRDGQYHGEAMLNEKDSNRLLFHYTTAQKAREFILHNGNLRFSPYQGTNDPKEKKRWEFSLGTNSPDADLRFYDQQELSTWLTRELKGKTLLTCFSRDGAGLTGDHTRDVGIRGYCKPRMWAQYGDNHRGVCLVFDQKRIREKFQKQFAKHFLIDGPVTYVDKSPFFDSAEQQFIINIDYLTGAGWREIYPQLHIRTHYQTLFFEKMSDWAGEAEWRFVTFSDSAEPQYLDYGDALLGVVFGDETSDDDRERIREMTPGVRHLKLKWKNSSPWYDFNDGFRAPLSSPF